MSRKSRHRCHREEEAEPNRYECNEHIGTPEHCGEHDVDGGPFTPADGLPDVRIGIRIERWAALRLRWHVHERDDSRGAGRRGPRKYSLRVVKNPHGRRQATHGRRVGTHSRRLRAHSRWEGRRPAILADDRPSGASRDSSTSGRDQNPIPPISSAPGMAGAGFFSGLSATTASVVRNRAAIDAAFCSAERVTFTGSLMPAASRSS